MANKLRPSKTQNEKCILNGNLSNSTVTARPGTVAHMVRICTFCSERCLFIFQIQVEKLNQDYLTEKNKNFSATVNHRKKMLAEVSFHCCFDNFCFYYFSLMYHRSNLVNR